MVSRADGFKVFDVIVTFSSILLVSLLFISFAATLWMDTEQEVYKLWQALSQIQLCTSWQFKFLQITDKLDFYISLWQKTVQALFGLCFGLLGSVTLNRAGKCPNVSSDMSSFVATNTAGKCYNITFNISNFVVANTAGECPDVVSKISSGFTLTNVETSCLTVACRLAAELPGHHPLHLLTQLTRATSLWTRYDTV